MADGLEVVEEGGDVGVLVLLALFFSSPICCSHSCVFGGIGLTIRYASLRNSSAVAVDGAEETGSVLCLVVRSVLIAGVISVILVSRFELDKCCGDVVVC